MVRLVEYKPKEFRRNLLFALFLILLIIRVGLLLLRLFVGLTIVGTVTLELLQYIILVLALFVIKRKRGLWFGIIAFCLVLNTGLFLLHNDGAEYHFTSPQRTNTLVVRERSTLISSGLADVYSREVGIFLRKLDVRLGTGENYTPFPSGQYRVAWGDEHTALLTYYDGYAYREVSISV